MAEVIHDDEHDTSEPVVRSLLAEQRPEWSDAALTCLTGSGTTNAIWRLRSGDDRCVVRLPRNPGAEAGIERECRLLPPLLNSALARIVEVPHLRHVGLAGAAFPMRWMVVDWIDGEDAWQVRNDLGNTPTTRASDLAANLADDLAEVVRTIPTLDAMPVEDRRPGDRGGPLPALLDRLERMLADPRWSADSLIDVAAVRRSAAESAEVAGDPVDARFVHGDLIPGNLVTVHGRLRAVIDWGGAGRGDPAQDLAPAWAVFDGPARSRFRAALEVDDATWLRARAFELEHAVGSMLYYRPRGHLLADVMARTLDRVLAESEPHAR